MRARRRADHSVLAGVPGLFGRQSPRDCIPGENWYRCSLNDFAGCCQVDPCALEDGCPTRDIVGPPVSAFTKTIDAPPVRRTTTVVVTPTSTLSPTSSAGDSEPTTDAAATTTSIKDSAAVPTGTSSPDKERDQDRVGGGGLPAGAIAGIVIGILALIFLLLAAWFFLRRRKRWGLAAREADFPPPSDENDEKFLGAVTAAAASATSPVFSYLGAKSPSLASTPGLGKYPSPASTPGLRSSGRYPSPASTPGLVGDPRSSKNSYVSGLGTPPASGVTPFPAVAQLDGTPVVLAEMDGTTAAAAAPGRLTELSVGGDGASPPARGQGLSLPTVARPGSGVLRGTLSSTEAERSGQTYVTSWSQYERGPNK